MRTFDLPEVEPFAIGHEFDERLVDERPLGSDPTQFLGFADKVGIEFNVCAHGLHPNLCILRCITCGAC